MQPHAVFIVFVDNVWLAVDRERVHSSDVVLCAVVTFSQMHLKVSETEYKTRSNSQPSTSAVSLCNRMIVLTTEQLESYWVYLYL